MVTVSVSLGALAGVAGYIGWGLGLGHFDWWPWATLGGLVGLAAGLFAMWER